MGPCGVLFSLYSVQSRFNPVDINGLLKKNKKSTSLYEISLEYFPCHSLVLQLRDFAKPCDLPDICDLPLLCDPQYNPLSGPLLVLVVRVTQNIEFSGYILAGWEWRGTSPGGGIVLCCLLQQTLDLLHYLTSHAVV